MEDVIFALDIGTRTVTGVLVEKNEQSIRLIDYCMLEHGERSMRDGQIHDVPAVAHTIYQVKETLEKRHGFPLKKACVAAAGRSLKTIEATASIDLREYPIKTSDDVKHLELSALQAAQEKLSTESIANSYQHYYCVGYSLLYYKLDGERIGSLIEQSGIEASVDIIATFLPKVVVESLLAAVTKANLEVEAMTLEPIAALYILIPESMRRLNVVLVDIGAGTSDIAITDRGTVVSYGMVPIAGDEITEAISDHYLLDFPEAERVKREIVQRKVSEIEDILGFTTTVSFDELVNSIGSEIDELSKVISTEIKRLNEKAPRAVMLVGGGSLTPKITEKIARELDLPNNRVAIRGIEAIQQLETPEDFTGGPEFITPVGIAIAAKERPVQYKSVFVNGKEIRLFDMNDSTVGDCIVQAGLEITKFYGRPGIASIVTVNGKEVTVPGGFGEAPQLFVNDLPVTVDYIVEEGDNIRIEQGKPGKQAEITLAELIGEDRTIQVSFNGKSYALGTIITVNGTIQSLDYIVNDKDEILWKKRDKVQDFFEEYFPDDSLTGTFPINVDHQEIMLKSGETKILVNQKEATMDTVLNNGDRIEIVPASTPKVKDVFREMNESYWYTIRVTFNGESVELRSPAYIVGRQGKSLGYESDLKPHDHLRLTKKAKPRFVFQDVFRYVELDLTAKTGNFKIQRNGEHAAFDTVIQDGDHLEIIWNED